MKRPTFLSRITAFLAVYSLFLVSCAVNPVTGKKEIMLMSESQEKALGASYNPQVIKQFGTYQDEKMQKFINEKGKKMGRISHRPTLDYQFRVVDSPVVNAFAVPGGYVYFTRGIMAHFNNEAEFAGVLGHEIGHVTARHSAKQYSQQMMAQLGLVVGMAASKEFRQYSDLASAGMQLMFLKFSRSNESQSDKLGVQYSTKIGYDAHQMAGFFKTIQRIQVQAGASVPNMLSTHPDPGDRFNRVHELAAKEQTAQGKSNLKVNRESYLRMIDGIVYGEDPNQGFVENGYFYHPEMRFQFPVPNSWQLVNSPAQVQMAPKDGKALIVFTLSEQKTLAAAQQAAVQADQLTVLSSRNISVNGNDAIVTEADLNAQVRLMMYLIKYNGNIYKFSGLAGTADFNSYKNYFTSTFGKFKKLTDPSKLNRKPERVRIKEVNRTASFTEVMKYYKMPSDRFTELAILNGMELNDQLEKGSLVKVIGN